MDVQLKCSCGSKLSLIEAPEPMACDVVYAWTEAHAQCLINSQTFFTVEDSELDVSVASAEKEPEAD